MQNLRSGEWPRQLKFRQEHNRTASGPFRRSGISEERKQSGAAFWIAVALVAMLVGYPLSVGPVVWLASRDYVPSSVGEAFLWPLSRGLEIAFPAIPEPLQEPIYRAINGYVQLWIPKTVGPAP
jgi:hypothetical protein